MPPDALPNSSMPLRDPVNSKGAFHLHGRTGLTNIFKARVMVSTLKKGNHSKMVGSREDNLDIPLEY